MVKIGLIDFLLFYCYSERDPEPLLFAGAAHCSAARHPFAFGAEGIEIRSEQYNNGAMNLGQKLW